MDVMDTKNQIRIVEDTGAIISGGIATAPHRSSPAPGWCTDPLGASEIFTRPVTSRREDAMSALISFYAGMMGTTIRGELDEEHDRMNKTPDHAGGQRTGASLPRHVNQEDCAGRR
jgi:hypothetical protein